MTDDYDLPFIVNGGLEILGGVIILSILCVQQFHKHRIKSVPKENNCKGIELTGVEPESTHPMI